MLKKILIANRGEIALRVMRAARELQIPAVAVYSEADVEALHVRRADEAVLLGPPPASESYLCIDKIIDAAKQTGCDAIHPGYGFLAENADFAQAVQDAGLIFIGPTAKAIKALGNKLGAREMMLNAKVQTVPGGEVKSGSIADFISLANRIGYPVMVKAASGGGGKGMRIVTDEEHLRDAVEAAQREAGSAFGDPTVYLEKYLARPRHIEFQVIADSFGNTVHLCERECSIQRRHQKIIEETPSMALTPQLRQEMGEAAVAAAKAANYTSAGTVEFLYFDGHYYFLEVNTRIQVEHPITEMTTGIDLVKEQIKIASGEKLSFTQSDIKPHGHATECRIYAEDPGSGFLPSAGKIHYLHEPAGANLRIDSGIYSGFDVPIYYDPILSKVITFGRDRDESIDRMILALKEYRIVGIRNNIRFLIDCLSHAEYRKGNLFTGFIDQHLPEWQEPVAMENLALALAGAVLASTGGATRDRSQAADITTELSPWQQLGSWEL
jgi:acetyl-CoA carboxylase biotin carboxylase subunit